MHNRFVSFPPASLEPPPRASRRRRDGSRRTAGGWNGSSRGIDHWDGGSRTGAGVPPRQDDAHVLGGAGGQGCRPRWPPARLIARAAGGYDPGEPTATAPGIEEAAGPRLGQPWGTRLRRQTGEAEGIAMAVVDLITGLPTQVVSPTSTAPPLQDPPTRRRRASNWGLKCARWRRLERQGNCRNRKPEKHGPPLQSVTTLVPVDPVAFAPLADSFYSMPMRCLMELQEGVYAQHFVFF